MRIAIHIITVACSAIMILPSLASAQPMNLPLLFFDDFNYDNIAQLGGESSPWTVVDGMNGPPAGAMYSADLIEINDDGPENKFLTFKALTTNDPNDIVCSRIQTIQHFVREGVWAARIRFEPEDPHDDSELAWQDGAVRTVYTINNLRSLENPEKYSEVDFEYMQNNQWDTNEISEGVPYMWMQSYAEYTNGDITQVKDYTAIEMDLEAGNEWYTLVCYVFGGQLVHYKVYADDDALTMEGFTDQSPMDHNVYPSDPMQLAIANWIVNDQDDTPGPDNIERTHSFSVDWVFYQQYFNRSISDIRNIVQLLRDNGGNDSCLNTAARLEVIGDRHYTLPESGGPVDIQFAMYNGSPMNLRFGYELLHARRLGSIELGGYMIDIPQRYQLISGYNYGNTLNYTFHIPQFFIPGDYLVFIMSYWRGGAFAYDYVSISKEANEQYFELGDTGIDVTMVWIEPGTFMMGAQDDEVDAQTNEYPRHEVTISQGYWIGKYEVTQEQWEAVMGEWNFTFDGNPNHPAEQISHEDISNDFLLLVNATEPNDPWRLPTEAEWEYACRAGSDETRFWWGDDPGYSELGDYAWYDGNSPGTCPVGHKIPNPWGLYDMHGNVIEWCSDWYDGSYYDDCYPSVTDPQGPVNGSYRVYRGGSWAGPAANCRSAFRWRNYPTDQRQDAGFRLVREAG